MSASVNFSQWNEGQELKPRVLAPITREELKAYGDASGDHNPIHQDESFAKAAGFPSVIAHGMLSMGYLGDYILGAIPEPQLRVKNFRCRFRKITYPGDVLTCSGTVTKVNPSEGLTVKLWVKNQNGETTTDGEALLIPA